MCALLTYSKALYKNACMIFWLPHTPVCVTVSGPLWAIYPIIHTRRIKGYFNLDDLSRFMHCKPQIESRLTEFLIQLWFFICIWGKTPIQWPFVLKSYMKNRECVWVKLRLKTQKNLPCFKRGNSSQLNYRNLTLRGLQGLAKMCIYIQVLFLETN